MDPITIVGFVAAVVQLIGVISKVVDSFNDMKDAPKNRAKLVREATGLLALFADLRYRVEETASTDPWFTGLRSLGAEGGPLMEFKSAMEDITDKLVPVRGGVKFGRVLRRTFDMKEIEAILSKIERVKSLVGLALQNDQFQLSLAIREEIKVGFQEMKNSRDVGEISQWLAAPVPSSNHNAAMRKKQPSTGEWFTKSKEFAEWKTGTRSFIWLHGIPGCGKTILCSTIIQDIISNSLLDPTIAVAYFYFDFNDLDKQRTEMLICSLIVQFAAQCPHLPESLRSAHCRSQSEPKRPTVEEMTTILRQMLESFNTTYILLDALDECADREDLLEFLEAVMSWNLDNLHLLTSSRREIDIATSLEPLTTCQLCIQSVIVDADIRVHILERLSNDPKLNRLPVDVQKNIESALMTGANGMFRWVVCQLESLRKCLRLDTLWKALNTLPKTLDETYERILSNLDEEYEEEALKVFELLCFSARPMQLDEIVEVLATDTSSQADSAFRPEARLLDPRDILTICSTLVSVTAATKTDTSNKTVQTQELRLAHFSVKEYLISDRLKKASVYRYHITPSSANFSIAKTCLTYLLHFESPTILTAKFAHEYPFIRYAAEFWPWHYRCIPDDADREAVDFLGRDLVESKTSCFIHWLRIFNPVSLSSRSDLKLDINRTPSPLYYMSYLGVNGVVQLLLNKGADVNAEGGTYGHALCAASSTGHSMVVQLLLKNGANVNAQGGTYGHALCAASLHGHRKAVELLLENGANINAQGGTYGHALRAASLHGHEKIVSLLLEKGANVNAQFGNYGPALSAASLGGHEKVVRLLLDKGADVNLEGGFCGHALSGASNEGHLEVVRLLLEKGADVNADSGIFGDALSAASCSGYEKLMRLLLEKGANVNAKSGRYCPALSVTSFQGREELVRFLLEKGADINAGGGRYGPALSAASRAGYERTVRLLLDEGADINAEEDTYGSALSSASFEGHEKVVRLLLEKGADVNAQSGRALREACGNGHEAVVRLLLKNKADVNLIFQDDGKTLIGGSAHDHKAMIQLLLEELELPWDEKNTKSYGI